MNLLDKNFDEIISPSCFRLIVSEDANFIRYYTKMPNPIKLNIFGVEKQYFYAIQEMEYHYFVSPVIKAIKNGGFCTLETLPAIDTWDGIETISNYYTFYEKDRIPCLLLKKAPFSSEKEALNYLNSLKDFWNSDDVIDYKFKASDW